MGKSMIDLQNDGKQVTSLSDTDLLLATTDPAGTPDDAVVTWGDLKTLLKNYLGSDVLTTQGDVLYRDASGLARLAAGTSGQFLQTQGAGANPQWASVSGDMVMIYDSLLASDSLVITWSSIPQTYKHLKIVGSARSSTATVGEFVRVQFNGDSGNNYDSFHMYVHHNGSLTTGELLAQASGRLVTCAGNNANAGDVSAFESLIPNYAGTTFTKPWVSPTALVTARSTTNLNIYYVSGQWRDTDAITDIVLTAEGGGDFKAGSRFTLYGLK